MQQIMDFLGRLEQNNNRPWFNAHKDEYLDCKAKFDAFALKLVEGIRSFDPSIGPLAIGDCTYRIYRDTRFSSDKSPYKIQMGAFVVPRGKKSGYSGYYFQIGPHDAGYPGGCMLATGDYCCEPRVLRTLREDIMADDENFFRNALKQAEGFHLDFDGALKKVPRGMPADQPYSDYLRLKSFCLVKETGCAYMTAPDLLDRTLNDFRRTKTFLDFINRAVSYVKEESLQGHRGLA